MTLTVISTADQSALVKQAKGKLVSLEHSISFTRVQDVSIRRLSSAVKIYGSKRPVPY